MHERGPATSSQSSRSVPTTRPPFTRTESSEIRARRARGEKITEEERDYAESILERRNQENSAKQNAAYAKAHPPRESTGLVPLTELAKGLYKGEPGGLYPGGQNTPPKAHLDHGLRLAAQISEGALP